MKIKMGMFEAYKLFWKNATKFNGRSRRAEYWWPLIVNAVIMFIITIIILFVMLAMGLSDKKMDITMEWILLIFNLICFLPLTAVTIRRLHDVGLKTYHGILTMVSYFVYIVLDFLFKINQTNFLTQMFGRSPSDTNAIIGNILVVIAIIFWLYAIFILIMTLQDSKDGTNQFGENPKYR